MDLTTVIGVLHLCCAILVSLLSLTESFSVTMGLHQGFQDYDDVFFVGTVVSLNCTVYGVEINNTNTTISLNDVLIFESKHQYNRRNGIFVSHDSSNNLVRLQITHLTEEHCGEYTCRVESDRGTAEDSYHLVVASYSPQCITKYDEIESNYHQLICYSQPLQDGEHFIWEKASRSGGNFTKVLDFTSRNLGIKVVSTLNDFAMENNKPGIYKCSIRMRNSPTLPLTEKICMFNLARTLRLDGPQLQESCLEYTQNFLYTQPGSNTQQNSTFWVSTLSSTPDFHDIHNNRQAILYICISGIIFTIIIVPLVILVVIVIKRNSKKYSDDFNTATAGTETHQTSCTTSSSFVNEKLDERKDQEKHSKHLINRCSECTENRKSQPHIYNEIEEVENINTWIGDYQEPSNILRGPYDITDLHSEDNESYDPHPSAPVSTTTPTKSERNINTTKETDKPSQTAGDIDNVVYEGYEEFKTSESAAYAVVDA